MTSLAAASAFFLAIHLLISGTSLRQRAVQALGERAYLGVFSLASAAGITWLALSYNAAVEASNPIVWDLGPGARHSGMLVMPVAFLLGMIGLLTPNPTAVGMEKRVHASDAATGILRITRHPFLWSVAIWSGFHLAANGDLASILFFGTFLVLSLAGTWSIDAKRSKAWGAAWSSFSKQTSNVPFAAILAGRNKLMVAELLTFRLAAALLAYAAVLFVHAWAFSASPFPSGYVPF